MPPGSIADGAGVVERILAYREGILHVRPGLSRCPVCDIPAAGPAFFRRHEIRSRTFWVVVERVVKKIPCWVTRWRSPCCGHPFTLQPPFALPHKRYTLPQMQERAEAYTTDDAVGYRGAVEQDGMPICHEQRSNDAHRRRLGDADDRTAEGAHGNEETPIPVRPSETCEPEEDDDDGTGGQLSHATLHRWITTLGGLTRTVGRALVLIRQRGAAVAFFRSLQAIRIAAGKYRSEGREQVLRTCRVLAEAGREYERTFGVELFPMTGTASGWT